LEAPRVLIFLYEKLDGRSAGNTQGEGEALGVAQSLGGRDVPQQEDGSVRDAPRQEDRGQVVLGADRVVDIGFILQRGDRLPDDRSRRRIVPARGRQADEDRSEQEEGPTVTAHELDFLLSFIATGLQELNSLCRIGHRASIRGNTHFAVGRIT